MKKIKEANMWLTKYEAETLFLLLSNHVHTKWRLEAQMRLLRKVNQINNIMRFEKKK